MTWTDTWGIDRRWIDAFDAEQTVSAETIRSLRAAIGAPPEGLEEIAPLVVRPGASVRDVAGIGTTIDVRCEDGSVRQLSGAIPDDFPLGYHRFRHADGSRTAPERSLIVSPGRCWLPDGWRAWGWTVQLYAVHSARSWGIGDLGDLRAIREWAQRDGAGFLLVNPLHAVAPTYPQEASPYLPVTRRFRNPLYLRVSDVPGAELVDLADFERDGRTLSGLPEVDRNAVWRVKRAALQAVFDAGGSPRTEFLGWRAELGQPLEEFATWCALADW